MASTQTLTELPTIQYTGMDYSTVISQIKEIIENNSNWSKNWTQFYNSEAGTMLIQLMAWICDNLAVRQDVLYNEQYLATASTTSAKLRLLNQIDYIQKTPSAAIVPLSIEFNNITDRTVNISCCRSNESSISEIQNSIFRFYGSDINGKNVPYEILSVNSDGTINYTTPIKLNSGAVEYTEDSVGKQITAVQGKTVYKEFTSNTNDGPVFVLDDSNIDLKTLVVYDITDNQNTLHVKVDNFMDTKVLNEELINYIVEKNDDGYFQIRYPGAELVRYGNSFLSSSLFEAGHTIGVLYRVSNGADGNIPENYLLSNETFYYSDGESVSATISNILAGYNGEDGESLNEAVKNAPLSIMTMNRAVTIDDYDRLLKKNDLVLNCRSYSPENMPEAFAKYFGRKINPQEVFSFMILNKNFNSCPTNKLNYFPWIELNKEPILNEKYVFGDANMNVELTSSDIYRNVYIKDSFANYKKTAYAGSEYDKGIDKGQWFYEHYDYDYYKNDKFIDNYKARMLKNFTLFKTSDYFRDTIVDEKTVEQYQMKIKLHENKSDSLYINNINNTINKTSSLSTDKNVSEEEVSAQYTATKAADYIDCINYKFIKFVLDDNLVITVNIQKEMEDLSEYDIGTPGNAEYVKAEYKSYYLKITNDKKSGEKEYWENLKNNYTIAQAKKLMISYINSKEYAEHRKGVLELIKDAVEEYSNFTYEDKDAPEIAEIMAKGEKKEQINSKTAIYSYEDNLYVLGELNDKNFYTKVYELLDNSSVAKNETELDEPVSKQEYCYRSVLANGSTAFIDLGMQDKNLDFGNDTLDVVNGYLYNNYKYTVDTKEGSYTAAEKKCLYTLKINDKIYAFRLDAYTAIKAFDMYNQLKQSGTSTGSVNFYDYFTYLGKGDLFYNISIEKILADNELNQTFSTILSKYPKYLSRGMISSSCILKDRMIKVKGDAGYDDNSNIDFVKFSIGSVATTLEYLVSPFNTEEETVYMFVPNVDGKSGSWIDIKADNTEYIKKNLRLATGKQKDMLTDNDRSFWVNIENAVDISDEFKNSGLWDGIEGFNSNNIDRIISDITSKEELTEDDIYNFRNILGGKLRIRYISKANYDTNASVRLGQETLTNTYSSGKEYDIRFEYINGETDLRISSVAEAEYSDKSISENNKILIGGNEKGTLPKDLIQELLGSRRQYEVSPVNYVGASSKVAKVINDKLFITSLNKGENSSLYFIQVAQRENLEIMFYLGLIDGYCYLLNNDSSNTYFERARSIKSYGYRRVELYIGDEDNDNTNIYNGIPYDDIKAIDDEAAKKLEQNIINTTLSVGDILVTSNDINYSNSTDFYLSYVLKNSDEIQINKRENFYYSDVEETNNFAKPDIVGIEGEAVEKNANGDYVISSQKSKFGIKITKNPVDTNSYYAIEQDTYKELLSIENKPVNIETMAFEGLLAGTSKDDPVYTQFGGAGRGIDTDMYSWDTVKSVLEYEVPVIVSIDDYTSALPKNGTDFVYSSDYDDYLLIANPGPVKQATGSSLYNALLTAAKESTNELLSSNYHTIVKRYYNSTNKLVLSGLTQTDSGNITFYYPDKATGNKCFEVTDEKILELFPDKYDLAVKLFYRNMFGTNKTNTEFYNLYPKEKMVGISYNEDDEFDYLNDNEVVCYLNTDHTEYFYCPTKKHHLKFVYRGFVDYQNKESHFGDYYVSYQGKSDGTFTGGYNFFLNKTKYSTFPDCPFYLHFVNDRTYEYKRTSGIYKTEQDMITEYMTNYKITGIEINFLKPYFKTFDIVATINYNANYDLVTVRTNVEQALNSKYKIQNISNINIGNKIYRSDIFKTILGVTGVESAEIVYFGYDYENQAKCPDQKYYLMVENNTEVTDNSEFYVVSVLAANDTNHGLVLSYKKSETTQVDL